MEEGERAPAGVDVEEGERAPAGVDVEEGERARLQCFRGVLLDWFSNQKRALPWRESRDPYKIWLSEIMLQQTRVETVKPYFHRFLERFPSLFVLAEADLSEVLVLWSGLGYYRRARHLHAAARVVVADFGGQVPDSFDELRSLPGIGRYTAGAILSIAYDKAVPVVDGNVYRVMSRLFCISEPLGSTALEKRCWSLAEVLVQGEAPGELNQALMELGALICTPGQPACSLCPLQGECQARATGQERALPIPKAKRGLQEIDVLWAVLYRAKKWLLVRRPDEGLFAGLWELPGVYLPAKMSPSAALLLRSLETLGLETTLRLAPTPFVHTLTHRRLQISLYRCGKVRGRLNLPQDRYRWVDLQELPELGMSSITKKVLEHVRSKNS